MQALGWKRIVFASLLAGVLGVAHAPSAAAQDDGLAPAREGQLHCYVPNVERKTCQSLAGYSFDGDSVSSSGSVMIMPQPLIVMSMTSSATMRDGALCGPLTQGDLDSANFTIEGVAATPEEAANMRAALGQQLAPLMNRDLCTRFAPAPGGGQVAESTLDGTPRPEMNQPVIWVRPEDGYSVGP
jgi:hypothetical protein